MTLRISQILCFVLIATLLARELAAEPQRPPESILEDTWQVVFVQGQRVGYAHSLSWEIGTDNDRRIWSESLMQMSISRFGQTLNMTVTQLTEEDDSGNLLSFKLDTNNPPISRTTVSGRVNGDTLHLTTTAAGKTTETVRNWEKDVKSPVYQDRLLAEDPIDVGESRTMRVFDPQFLKAGDLTLTGQEPAETELLDGSRPTLNRIRIVQSLVPNMVLTAYQNEEGESLKSESNLLNMVIYTVSQEEAVKEIAGEQLDLALDTMVRVEPLPSAHELQTLLYEISVNPPRRMLELPEADRQQVRRVDEQTVRVTVHSHGKLAETQSTTDIVDGKPYLGATRYLECEHPQVIAHATSAAKDLTSPSEIALAMEKYVHRKLTEKNFSTALATAAEVASNLEGDCTEHAMLLAALLRVRDIPSRVAVGLVYSRQHAAFVGHMWTEAFIDGQWLPLDATLAHGGIGAAHLKFSDSSLSDDGPAPITAFVPLVGIVSKLRIQVIPNSK